MDGANSDRLLNKLDQLMLDAPLESVEIIHALYSFRRLVKGCFSMNLHKDYSTLIQNFTSDYIAAMDYAETQLDTQLTVSWKVHMVTAHLQEWFDKNKVGLGLYAEQTSEACHSKMKYTLKRFQQNEFNPRHEEHN